MFRENDLIQAFRYAVQGEVRYGIRDDCKVDVEARWARVIELIAKLKAKKLNNV